MMSKNVPSSKATWIEITVLDIKVRLCAKRRPASTVQKPGSMILIRRYNRRKNAKSTAAVLLLPPSSFLGTKCVAAKKESSSFSSMLELRLDSCVSFLALLISFVFPFLYRFTAGRIIFLIEYAEIRDVARALVSSNLGIPLLSHILSNSLVIEVFGIGSAILRKR